MSVPVLRWPSLALAFALEIGALVAFAVWGAQTGDRTWSSLSLAVGAPLVGALVWGMFASPRAPFSAPVLTPVITVLFFGAAALALRDAGHPRLAAAFVIVAALNTLLLHLAPASTTPTEEITGSTRGPSGSATRDDS